MKVEEILAGARDAVTAERVYSEPVEHDGLTVITAAAVSGGAGGGSSNDKEGQGGAGAGFGLGGRPVGAYVIKDGRARWQPALDVNRLITVAGCVAVATVLAAAGIVRKVLDR
ncbi:sporulation protein [Nocardia arizonensis]|uniref:sporulation protein n=1 Tax=Nocardia arizonensis TaxID=1141647 RepID=UPI0006D0785C|nr:sporulation protein [Nocardia arizonensis]